MGQNLQTNRALTLPASAIPVQPDNANPSEESNEAACPSTGLHKVSSNVVAILTKTGSQDTPQPCACQVNRRMPQGSLRPIES